MTKYKPLQSKVPSQIRDMMTHYSIDLRKEGLKLREIVSIAIDEHVKDVRNENAPIVVDEVRDFPEDSWEKWIVYVDDLVLKECKKLCIDYDEIELAPVVTSAYIKTLKKAGAWN